MKLGMLALMMLTGSAVFAAPRVFVGFGVGYGPAQAVRGFLVLGLGVHLFLILAERFVHHPNLDALMAARLLTGGAWRGRFWGGVVVLGTLLPALLVLTGSAVLGGLGSLLALGGLYVYEDLWVRAGQAVPLS